MDPDACLDEIRSIVKDADDDRFPDALETRFDRLVDLVDGLDGWMTRNGHPPRAWSGDGPQSEPTVDGDDTGDAADPWEWLK